MSAAEGEAGSSNAHVGTGTPPRHLPGEPGVWVLIGGDMLVFSLFFLTFLNYRNGSPGIYATSQEMLNVRMGLANTIILLTSSWFVAQAVQAVKAHFRRRARILFGGAFACGLLFCGVKLVEYREKLSTGIDPSTNEFYMFYFMLTGIHLMHVLVGLAVLLVMRHKISADTPLTPSGFALVESGATFWHLVDILWIILFALLYLVR